MIELVFAVLILTLVLFVVAIVRNIDLHLQRRFSANARAREDARSMRDHQHRVSRMRAICLHPAKGTGK